MFVIREEGLTEGLEKISRCGEASVLNGNGEEEAHFHLGHHWSKTVSFSPVMLVKVTKNHNAIFGTRRVVIGVAFDGGDGHSWKSVANKRTETLVFLFRNVFPCVGCVMKTEVFFKVGTVPNVFVRCN